jgi:hypothetical protein
VAEKQNLTINPDMVYADIYYEYGTLGFFGLEEGPRIRLDGAFWSGSWTQGTLGISFLESME